MRTKPLVILASCLAALVPASLTAASAQTFSGPPVGQVSGMPFTVKPTLAPDYAYAAYQTGFYERAFTEATARIARDNGDAAAMTLLGEILRQGLGIKPDPAKAAQWYRLAHERGDANASFALAMATLKGEGVPRNDAAARQLLESAAPRQPQAAYNLALIQLGSAEAGERRKAISLLESAANAEIPDAQHALAVLKRKGQDTSIDLEGAASLMRRAARNGLEAGEIEYAIILFNGQGVARDEKAAADIFQRLAVGGNPIAQNRYARLLSAGRGRAKDVVGASAWNIIARQQGLEDASLDRLFDNFTPDDKGRALALAVRLAPASLTGQPATGQ